MTRLFCQGSMLFGGRPGVQSNVTILENHPQGMAVEVLSTFSQVYLVFGLGSSLKVVISQC
jgi:hypothetical protein